ncbi:MAG TPA: hypothetical protein VFP10_15430 [Candidatus Eisenbacteria bacterium]|nr:hypothetical protein [Candidatus Eisenbacteria bacterium]
MNDHAELEIVRSEEPLVSLRGVARAIRKRRLLFLGLSLGLPVLAAVIMLLTPNKFTAWGEILCEMPQAGMMGLPRELMGQFSSLTGIPTQVSPSDIFLAILRSRRVATAVATDLNLPDYYEVKGKSEEERMERTLTRLSKRVEFDARDLVTISVAATDTDPKKAADIVNAYLKELEKASQTLSFSRARKTRMLVEEALHGTQAKLDSTRNRMQDFQERYGVFSIEKQTEGTLKLLTGLQSELLAAQTQRNQLRTFTSVTSPRVQGLDLQIAALRNEISKIVGTLGSGQPARVSIPPVSSSDVVQPLSDLPQLASQYSRIFIDLQVQEAKYNVLAAQLEQTRIEESQSVPAFETLDWAVPPHRKSGPFRTVFTLAAFLAGTLTALLLVVILEDLSRRIDPATRKEIVGLVADVFRRR